MSVEVPFIILIISIPTYFLCKWFLKKLQIGNKNKQKFIALIPTLILSPIIYFTLIMIWIFSISYYSNIDFDKNEWEANVEERFKMSNDLINSEILIGKTKQEIIELLGAEYYMYNENRISYYIGHVPGFFNIDPDVLVIYFEKGKVVKAEQYGT